MEDWIKFTSLETLGQKAGVGRADLVSCLAKAKPANEWKATEGGECDSGTRERHKAR